MMIHMRSNTGFVATARLDALADVVAGRDHARGGPMSEFDHGDMIAICVC
jgi:hypothetical protein